MLRIPITCMYELNVCMCLTTPNANANLTKHLIRVILHHPLPYNTLDLHPTQTQTSVNAKLKSEIKASKQASSL